MLTKHNMFFISSAFIILFLSVISLKLGLNIYSLEQVYKSIFTETEEIYATIINEIRFPRLLFASIAGTALALSGTGLQGLFRNPLTDPSIIGVSSGAAFFASLTIVLSQFFPQNIIDLFSEYLLAFSAFIGGIITTFFVFYISNYRKNPSVATLLLTGLAINAFFFGGIGFMTFIANDQQLRTLTFWNLGSLGSSSWTIIYIALIPVIISSIGIIRSANSLNALSLGEANAKHLGIDVKKLNRKVIIYSALSVGVITAFCGIISFVGIIVPHVSRLLFGPNHKFLVISSIFIGIIFMIFTDLMTRTLFLPSELPLNIITSIIGAPLFMFLLLKDRRSGESYA